jgi:hypothetical protein
VSLPCGIHHGHSFSKLERDIERQRTLEFLDWHLQHDGEPAPLWSLLDFLTNGNANPDDSSDFCWVENLTFDMESEGLINGELEVLLGVA